MKPYLFASLALLSLSAHAAGPHVVTMKSISFDPKSITIPAGDSVVWENKSYTEHSATEQKEGGFDTGLVKPKQKSKAITFKEPGEFHYLCSIHGKTMSAMIRVDAPKQ
jgi:plastocyanin